MKTLKPHVLVVTAIIVVIIFLFWFTWLCAAYVADELNSPPADERSIPTAKAY